MPPLVRKDEGSGLAASMIQPYSVIDWANSHAKPELVMEDIKPELLEDGISYPVCRDGEGGANVGEDVEWRAKSRARPQGGAIGAQGPERIFCTTDAVAGVSFTAVLEQVTVEQTNDCGSKGQTNRSKITLSWTPSSIPHASRMVFTKYSYSHKERKVLDSYITTWGQIPKESMLDQYIAGVFARILTKSVGDFCATVCPCLPPVEHPFQ